MASDTRRLARTGLISTASTKIEFPPLYNLDDTRSFNPILRHPLFESESLQIPTLDSEFIQVPEHLIPPSDDIDTDTLPVDQHPSYPLGNPYLIHHAPKTLQPAKSSQPKLDPRVHAKLSLHTMHDSTREDMLMSVATGSASAQAAIEDKKLDHDATEDSASNTAPSYTLQPDGTVQLAHHLQMRAQISTVSKPPTWPFTRFGPGPSARSYAALYRNTGPADATAETSIWSDFALEQLVPKPRPDSYTLPSSLNHPYVSNKKQSSQSTSRRARPSDIPPALGVETAELDHLWLDVPEDSRHSMYEDGNTYGDAWRKPMLRDASFDLDLAPNSTTRGVRIFSPLPRSRQGSASYAQESQEFYRTLQKVQARRRRNARSSETFNSMIPPDLTDSCKKHRIHRTEEAHSTTNPSNWAWGSTFELEHNS